MGFSEYFKNKEEETKNYLKNKGYFVIRLDGKAFHTFTRNLEKPFDKNFINWMNETTKYLCENIQGVKLAYTQSDEISLILTDLDSEKTQMWFQGNIQKITSVSSSMATAIFNQVSNAKSLAFFDSRVFRLESQEDLNNYLQWRQEDAIKNSITMIARHHYSDKEIFKKNSNDKIEMIKNKGDNYHVYDLGFQRGRIVLPYKKEVPFTHPKTLEQGVVMRNFWKIDNAPLIEDSPIVIKFKEQQDE